MTTPAHAHAQAHAARFRQQLHEWLRIPSISTLPERAADVRRAADWLAEDLRRVGLTTVEVVSTAGHPIVYAEWLGAGDDAPTVLIYGHYDVQPAEMADGWTSEPFEPVERDGLIYARGASDDKGQVYIHVKAIEALLAADGRLPVNVKLVVEGEEEVSSLHLGAFVAANRERLKADVCVISDSGMLSPDQPSIVYALRGLVYMEIEVFGPATDLHSGVYGGTVHNPAQALAEIIAALHAPDGSVSVPGFYDEVLPLDAAERAELAKTDWSLDDWSRATGLRHPWGEAAYTLRERVGARPTLEINGMVSGFYGEGAKTVLPARALAKVSCRLVANQDPHQIYERICAYVAQIAPPTVRVEVRKLHQGDPAFVDRGHPMMATAMRAYEQGWGAPPLFLREGGSIPIVANFQRDLGLPVVLMGYGLTDDGAHGPDEHFSVEMFHKGIDTAIYFLQALGR